MQDELLIQIIRFFPGKIGKIAVAAESHKVLQIIWQIVFYCILHGREDGALQILFILQLTECVFKGFNDRICIRRLHLPNRNGMGVTAFVCIGDIEIVHQALPAAAGVFKHGNAFGAAVDPAPESVVPALNGQHGRGIRPLGKKKKLLIKTQPIVSAGTAQKGLPNHRITYNILCSAAVQVRY